MAVVSLLESRRIGPSGLVSGKLALPHKHILADSKTIQCNPASWSFKRVQAQRSRQSRIASQLIQIHDVKADYQSTVSFSNTPTRT